MEALVKMSMGFASLLTHPNCVQVAGISKSSFILTCIFKTFVEVVGTIGLGQLTRSYHFGACNFRPWFAY